MKHYLIAILTLICTYSLSMGQTVNTAAQSLPYGHNTNAGKYYDIRGFRMYCEQYGKGTPVLIIHGNGRSIADYKDQIPYFSKEYRVIVADSRAQGQSADRSDSLTYEMMADDYAALLTKLHLDSVQVIGWSDGGICGLLLAIRHPEKVKKLVTVGANLWPDSTAVNEDVLQLVRPKYESLLKKVDKNEEEKNALKVRRLVLEQPHISLTEVGKISCPTLLISGDHDVIKKQHSLLISDHIPKSYLWIVPGSGHSVPVVFKELFNHTVDDFFKRDYREITGVKRFY